MKFQTSDTNLFSNFNTNISLNCCNGDSTKNQTIEKKNLTSNQFAASNKPKIQNKVSSSNCVKEKKYFPRPRHLYIITYEEALIEYIKRLYKILDIVDFMTLDKTHLKTIDQFINNPFWETKLEGQISKLSFQQRLKERVRKLKIILKASTLKNQEIDKEKKNFIKSQTHSKLENILSKALVNRKFLLIKYLFMPNENIGIVSHIYKSKRIITKKPSNTTVI